MVADEPQTLDDLDCHIFECLQWTHFDSRGGWLGLEGNLFLGERVDALACLHCWLADRADLEHAWENELTNGILADVRLDHACQTVEDGCHLLAAERGFRRNRIEDLGFIESIFNGC